MAKDRSEPELDRRLADLPPELRWREWMRRIEAVLFASASPVPREDLARVVGQRASVDLLVEDLAADLEGRSFEVAQVAGGWMLRTMMLSAPRSSICFCASLLMPSPIANNQITLATPMKIPSTVKPLRIGCSARLLVPSFQIDKRSNCIGCHVRALG